MHHTPFNRCTDLLLPLPILGINKDACSVSNYDSLGLVLWGAGIFC
jgi:hypothetical protein